MSIRPIDTTNGQTPPSLDPPAHTGTASASKGQNRLTVIVALIALYILWGSTYLGMSIAMQSFPPFLMTGIRFVIAGAVIFALLCARKATLPQPREWLSGAIVGVFLLVGGNAAVAFAEQSVPTGLSAVAIGAVPLWVALFSGFFGRWPGRIEWYGLALGFVGLILLNLGGSFLTDPLGTIILLIAPLSWAFGSVISRHLPMPAGGMSSAVQMLCAGTVLLIIGLSSGERIVHWPTSSALWAMLFLITGGSLVAFTAYMYLLSHVRPALATSYAYINPVVAVGLGVWLAGETVTIAGIIAMVVILSGVVLVTLGHKH